MSTTSCPRCSGQVTLPVGVDNSAQVRCPLCHAHYTLADALVNMPPLLEVVDTTDDAEPDSWFDAPSADEDRLAAKALDLPASERLDSLEPPEVEPSGALHSGDDGTDDELEFTAEEADDDELAAKDNDTEIEELSFSTFDAPAPEALENSDETDTVETVAAGDDGLLLFDQPVAAAAAGAARDEDAEEELNLDFDGERSGEAAEAGTVDFDAPLSSAASERGADDEVRFDLDAPEEMAGDEAATIEFDNSEGIRFDAQQSPVGEQAGLREFGDLQIDPSGEAEEIPLDLGDDAAAAPLAVDADEEPSDGKKKRKQEKGKAAAAANGKRKRSSLVGYALPALIAVPLVLYLSLWMGFDVVGLSGLLPRFMLPAEFARGPKQQYAQADAPAAAGFFSADKPITLDPNAATDSDETQPSETETPDTPSEDMPADEPPSLEPGEAAAPAADESKAPPADADSADKTPAGDPVDNLFAPSEPEKMPAKDAEPAADPFGEPKPAEPPAKAAPTDDPFAPADAPVDAPAKEPDSGAEPAADDPFGEPKPAEPAAESPAEPPAKAAPADDPFAPAAEPEMPDKGAAAEPADDPFSRPAAPDASPAEPAADRPSEPEAKPQPPAADSDPFGTPANDAKPAPAADDPFAPAPAEKPAAETPPELPAASVTEPLPEPDTPAEPVEVVGPRDTTPVSPAEVASALKATLAAGQQMAAAEAQGDGDQIRKARANFYVKLFQMADALTLGQLGPGAAQLDPQLRTLEPMIRQQLSGDPKQLDLLKVFGARWFAFPKRTTNGVVVAGTVESVDHAGKLYHAKIKPGQNIDAAAVTIVCAKDPALAAGDEVVTLGTIVEQPGEKLAGYQGSEPAVVWSGMTLKVSPPAN